MREVKEVRGIGKEVFVGVDVHKRTYALALVEKGKPIRRLTMPAQPQALLKFLKREYTDYQVSTAYEAGFSGFVLHRRLEAGGHLSCVVNPSGIPIAANDRVKTDKRDAVKLSKLLSLGELTGIRIPKQKQEDLRLLTRTREQLVRERSRLGIQIKSKLMQYGLLDSQDDRPMTSKLLREFLAMKLPKELRLSIEALSTIYECTRQQIQKLEKELKERMQDNPLVALYESVPGVGAISAAILWAELDDMSQFRNERAIFRFTGLTPEEHSSGEHVRRGHISRQGSGRLRHVLVEVAWRAIQQDASLKEVYERLKRTRGAKRAIVAVARRLIGRIRACLRDSRQYRLPQAA